MEINALSRLIMSASFSASRIQISSCRSVGFCSNDSTDTKISVSIVRKPLRAHSAVLTCLSKALRTFWRLIMVEEMLVPQRARSICFLEQRILSAPPHLGQQAPGGVNPWQFGFLRGGQMILSNWHLGSMRSDMGPTARQGPRQSTLTNSDQAAHSLAQVTPFAPQTFPNCTKRALSIQYIIQPPVPAVVKPN